MKPIIIDCRENLSKYTDDNENIRTCVRRFDEVISEKVNKFTITELRKEFMDNYLRAEQLTAFTANIESINAKNNKIIAECES